MVGNLIKPMQKKVAVSAVPPSAMRRQGLAGLLGEIRAFCADFPLESCTVSTPQAFERLLDDATAQLQLKGAELRCQWGAARKAINLFLRDATYNHYLRDYYGLSAVESWLELPLDGEVAIGLRDDELGHGLPEWPGVSGLSPA